MKNYSVEIKLNSIFDYVNNHLALIGSKSEKDFSHWVIPESAKTIIEDYVNDAVNMVVSIRSEWFVSKTYGSAESSSSYIIEIMNTGDEDVFKIFGDVVLSFVRNYCLSKYLLMIGESVGEKYASDANESLKNMVSWIFKKSVPDCKVELSETVGLCN